MICEVRREQRDRDVICSPSAVELGVASPPSANGHQHREDACGPTRSCGHLSALVCEFAGRLRHGRGHSQSRLLEFSMVSTRMLIVTGPGRRRWQVSYCLRLTVSKLCPRANAPGRGSGPGRSVTVHAHHQPTGGVYTHNLPRHTAGHP